MKKKNPFVVARQPDGRPARPAPDPQKATRFGIDLLPQVPSVAPSKLKGAPHPVRRRHPARPK